VPELTLGTGFCFWVNLCYNLAEVNKESRSRRVKKNKNKSGSVKVAETRIYIKFIAWFLVVSLLPLLVLFVIVYIFHPEFVNLINLDLQRALLIGVFLSLASVFFLSLIATRHLARSIANPIEVSVKELAVVADNLFKSVQNITEISQTNSEVSQFLLASSQKQQSGLKLGGQAVASMVKSLNQIVVKTEISSTDTKKINSLAKEGGDKSNTAISSLVAIKNLVTENQKLSQALDQYTNQVKAIAKRVEVLAEESKLLSLNVSIEASKSSFSDDFSSLISQIRELNLNSEQAASSIQGLAGDMQRQIQQAKAAAIFEWQETNKSISVISQTIKFLNKIVGNVGNISQSMEVINKETNATQQKADSLNSMIRDLNKESSTLVKHVDDISRIIYQQLTLTKALYRSSSALSNVTDNLNNLVGKKE
jgi:methyl-accepting chemotaxis protein